MKPPRPKIVIWAAVTVSLMLFVTALGMPALEFANDRPVYGLEVLLSGWLGVFTGDFPSFIPWFANPLYLLAILFALASAIRAKDRKIGRIISQCFCAAALGVGMVSFMVSVWRFEYSKTTPVQNLGVGFYYWMGSFLVLLVLLFFVRKEQSPEDEDGEDAAP